MLTKKPYLFSKNISWLSVIPNLISNHLTQKGHWDLANTLSKKQFFSMLKKTNQKNKGCWRANICPPLRRLISYLLLCWWPWLIHVLRVLVTFLGLIILEFTEGMGGSPYRRNDAIEINIHVWPKHISNNFCSTQVTTPSFRFLTDKWVKSFINSNIWTPSLYEWADQNNFVIKRLYWYECKHD